MFASRLSALLQDKKISSADFARQLGKTRQRIYEWTSNRSRPDYETLVKLAKFFDVSTDYLLGNDDPVDLWQTIPILGTVPAGNPIEAIEYHEGSLSLPGHIAKPNMFGLKVKGDSMEPGIKEKDIVFVVPDQEPQQGKVIVARVDGEATIKRFYKNEKFVILRPDNPKYEPIMVDCNCESQGECFCVGSVQGLWRGEVE